jgi:acid phosphatase (class A)
MFLPLRICVPFVKPKRMRELLLSLASLTSISAYAQWQRLPSASFQLEPHPIPGSAEYEEDFRILLESQKERKTEDCLLSRQQKHASFESLYGHSDLLSAEEFRRLHPLLSKASKLTVRISSYHKRKFSRPRPYDVNSQIIPCVDRPGGQTAYPSSHAAVAAVGSCLLEFVFPDRAVELARYSDHSAQLRVAVGVHHPSDVEAGKLLGRQICQKLLEDDAFRYELEQGSTPSALH